MDAPGKNKGEPLLESISSSPLANVQEAPDANADASATDIGTVATRATDALTRKRFWGATWATVIATVAALGSGFAGTQTASLSQLLVSSGFWSEFWQPRETNRWKRPSDSREPSTLTSLRFASDGKTALAIGPRTVFRTGDAGANWQVVTHESTLLESVAFSPDGKTALAVGLDTALRSADAGLTWQSIQSPALVNGLDSVVFAPDGKAAWAVRGRYVVKSVDAGQTWQIVATADFQILSSIAFARGGQLGLAVGGRGAVMRSEDAGRTWQRVPNPYTAAALSSLSMSPDGKTVLAVAGGRVLRSENAAQSWEVSDPFTEATPIFAIRQLPIAPSATSNGDIRSLTPQLRSLALSTNGTTALAVGDFGTVMISVNAGKSWERVRIDAIGPRSVGTLQSVAFTPDGNTSLAVGDGGTVLKSLDSGQTWQPTALYAKTTAPWFDALLALLALGCLGIGLFLFRRGKSWTERLGLMNNAVTDKPIESASEDRLAFTPVVDALSTFLRHDATRPSLAIAINAAWGMGKSSFMNMLASDLKNWGSKPVHFNVWHHQHEEVLLAPLLQAIVTQAIPGWRTWAGRRFRVRLWCERRANGNWAFWLGSCALLTLPAYVLWLGLATYDSGTAFPLAMFDRAVRDVHWLGSLLTGGVWEASVKNGSLGDLATGAFMAFRSEPVNALIVLGLVLFVASWVLLFSYTLRPFPASPAILVASMEKRFSLSKAEAQTDFRQRFRRHFGQVARALQPKTMVIFIDDLDRCKPEKAAELLEAANYLSDAGPCFLILGVARDIVEAQVASAHKVVAEEQAAMNRVRDGAPVVAPNNSDADRLGYAQKYLRKLVQLDIALPRLDSQNSIQILLGKLEADARPAIKPPKTPWLSAKAWSTILIWTFLLSSAAVIGWRTDVTLAAIKTEKAETVKNQATRVAGLRVNMEEVRLYATWLNDMASAKPTGSEKLLPSPMLYKARADMMQTVVRDLDAGLALLEREAPDGQRKTFDGLQRKVFDPGYAVFTAYIQRVQIDGRQWRDIKAGLWAYLANKVTWNSPLGEITLSNGSNIPSPGLPPPVVTQPAEPEGEPWPLGHLIAAALPAALLFWVAFRARDNYTVQPSPEYQDAVRVWQQELLRNPDTASPREMKRFMNLSRYAVARLQAMIKTAPPDTPLPISETCVVELTAKWLARDRALSQSDVRKALRKNGAKKEEVALFLGIVGDLSEGDGE